ncbi:protoporphyrinogen oxidase [Corynebacterium bovis]|uniref:protoporphyrinogen oxidase n=1 Tax=Corynebacterium bovis TaxID=36808 RepID=UPI0032B6FE64
MGASRAQDMSGVGGGAVGGRGGRRPVVAVIGGGVSGLAAAWELRRRTGSGTRILLLEAYGRLGGKLKTVDFDGGPVDMGAEAFLVRREDFTRLIDDLGLSGDLVSPSGARSAFFVDGELTDIPSATVMGVPAEGAAVAGVVSAEACRAVDAERDAEPLPWVPGDDVNVGQLVGARFGREVVDRLVSPLLGGVYSCDADDLGLRATVPQLAEALDGLATAGRPVSLGAAVREVLDARPAPAAGETRPPAFGALRGGYRSLVRALAAGADAEIKLNTAVESIGRYRGGFYLEPVGEVDAVVVATPAPTAAVLLADTVPDAAEILSAVDLASSAVVGMRFDDAFLPDRSGVLIGTSGPTAAKAFTFSSRKWPHLGERGGDLVRASFGSFGDDSLVEAPDDDLLGYALRDLRTVLGPCPDPAEIFVQRWWGGLPRYGVGHAELTGIARAAVDAVPGIALAGSFLDGVGVPACAVSGREAARSIAAEL